MNTPILYPCTGNVGMEGFGAFLEAECTHPRRNILLFSQELCGKFGVPNATMVNSGSSANLVACLTLAERLRKEGKPLTAATSAFTFPTTVSALLLAGFSVTYVDVDEQGFNMSLESLEKLPEPPSLVALTHFLGFAGAARRIAEHVHSSGGLLLQDACETMVLERDGVPLHTYGDITTWSFYHPHHLSAYGGGAVICTDPQDYEVADSIAHWGRACRCHIDRAKCHVPAGPAHQFTYERTGLNVELSELNACFGRWQLRHFDEAEARRKRHYGILLNTLRNHPALRVYEPDDVGGSMFVFPVLLTNGMDINQAWEALSGQGVEIRTLMGGVSNEQAAFAHITAAADDLPRARHMARHAFFVGIHHTLQEEAVQAVADIIRKTFPA